MLSGSQKHLNCFDQEFKNVFEIFSLKLTTFFFTKFKAKFGGWYFTKFMYSLLYVFRLHTSSKCWGDRQVYNKLGTPGVAKSFLRGPPIF